MPVTNSVTREIAHFILSKVSESLGQHLAHPDTTELSVVPDTNGSDIAVTVRTKEGLRHFTVKVREVR